MRLKPDTLALTALLALLTSLGPLATDMYLASLPDITWLLDASVAQTQYTLSIYLICFACGQLIYGPVADKFGRRPVLLVSLAAILIADIACAMAPQIEILILARMAQGVATAGPIVLARSIVRDLYSGARAGKEMALMGAFMGIVISTAPFLGGLVHVTLGWRATFLAQTLLCAVTLAIVIAALPETARERRTERLTLFSFPRIYAGLMAEPAYRTFVAINMLAYAGLFSFITSSSFILQGVYGWSELEFGVAFGVCSLAYICGTFLGTRLVRSLGLVAATRLATAFLSTGGLAMTLLMVLKLDNPFALLACMTVYMVGVGVALPQSAAAAMTFYPSRAGAASSLLGFVQMTGGAVAGIIVGSNLSGNAWPLAIALTLAGTLAMAIAVSHKDIASPE
ncbi:MAG: multidrug effflux MFS transporter [Alphaproteobacteria bacterium]